ncbi:MAG TPA: GIDE domain-containing protein, partial [Candidatus Polarisedimenticolia bacterium]|nr:GIDE domain-containing protein [Candidatus Polarisedimenticolia bacterium]
VLIRYGFLQLRKKNMIENVPASPIRSVALGLAEIQGHAPRTATLPAPLSGASCHFYRYQVEEERQSGKGGRRWVTVDQGISNVPFHVEDATGRILVNPEGADVLLGRDYQRVERGEGWFAKRRRYREWRIDAGDFVYVIGTVTRQQGEAEQRRAQLTEHLRRIKKDPAAIERFDLDANQTLDEQEWAGIVAVVKDDIRREELDRSSAAPCEELALGAGELESTFVISDRGERSLTSLLGWKALGSGSAGVAGFMTMTVSILGRLGVLPGGWSFPWETLFH